MEVSERISATPTSVAGDAVPENEHEAVFLGTISDASDKLIFLADAFEALRRKAADGVVHAIAALTLMPEPSVDRFDALAGRMSAWEADAGIEAASTALSSAGLYRLAFVLDAKGWEEDAVLLLGLLASSSTGERDGSLGLAVIAARRKAFDAAMALAQHCLATEARHPRALCIVGICELERGNLASAQSHLAVAARIARANPAYRDDLQAAQRALLQMHLA